MSRFHYRPSKGLLVISDDKQRLEVGPLAILMCSWRDCTNVPAHLVRTGLSTWQTLCTEHHHEVDEEPGGSTRAEGMEGL